MGSSGRITHLIGYIGLYCTVGTGYAGFVFG